MRVILKPELYQIKNGFGASLPELHLAAHGDSAELAKRNFEKLIFLFLRAFEREGTLEDEVWGLETKGVKVERDGPSLAVIIED
jgi:predicted RNase H-like HicB family nuclease